MQLEDLEDLEASSCSNTELFWAKGAAVPVAYASSGAVLGPSSDYAAGAPLPAERDYHRRLFSQRRTASNETQSVIFNSDQMGWLGYIMVFHRVSWYINFGPPRCVCHLSFPQGLGLCTVCSSCATRAWPEYIGRITASLQSLVSFGILYQFLEVLKPNCQTGGSDLLLSLLVTWRYLKHSRWVFVHWLSLALEEKSAWLPGRPKQSRQQSSGAASRSRPAGWQRFGIGSATWQRKSGFITRKGCFLHKRDFSLTCLCNQCTTSMVLQMWIFPLRLTTSAPSPFSIFQHCSLGRRLQRWNAKRNGQCDFADFFYFLLCFHLWFLTFLTPFGFVWKWLVPHCTQWLMIINYPVFKWLFHWGYTLFNWEY